MDDEKVGEVVEHLQTAALELIAAARIVLDIAEEAVKEPGGAIAFAQRFAPHAGGRPGGPQSAPDATSKVQRIRVS